MSATRVRRLLWEWSLYRGWLGRGWSRPRWIEWCRGSQGLCWRYPSGLPSRLETAQASDGEAVHVRWRSGGVELAALSRRSCISSPMPRSDGSGSLKEAGRDRAVAAVTEDREQARVRPSERGDRARPVGRRASHEPSRSAMGPGMKEASSRLREIRPICKVN